MKLFLGALLFTYGVSHHAQQKRIYIANDDHTDYIWSANEIVYRDAFLNMLDYYIRKADSSIALGMSSDLQSRFNCDGYYWLWIYEQNKNSVEVKKLIDRIRSGHISVPYNAVVSCYGGMPAEATLRGMYYAGSLERRFNLKLDQAVAMEHATMTLGMASLWAGSGAKYSWKGICACNTPFGRGYPDNRSKQMYWYTGLDGKKILMKWYSLNDSIPPGGKDKNQSLGGYSEARNPLYAVEACKKKFAMANYKGFQVAGAFGYGWDDIQTYSADEFINAAKNNTDKDFRVIVSNQQDFFIDFEKTHGSDLPAMAVSYGNERDLLCASLAETSSNVKRSLEKLRSAEAMATLVTMNDPEFGSDMDSARIKSWMGYGLYWEHDWSVLGGVASSAERAAWERKIERQISSYTDDLYNSARDALGKQIVKTAKNETFFVFNPLGWSRTDYADYPYNGIDNIIVSDNATKLPVPHQLIQKSGSRYIRILATDIPSAGYKTFEIKPGRKKAYTPAAELSSDNSVAENEWYKIKINGAGVILSIIDKKNGDKEIIDGAGANALDSSSGSGRITVENNGPVSTTLVSTSTHPLKHTSRITIYKALQGIVIDNQILQNFSDVRHWKFAFNVRNPETWHEETGAILKAKTISKGGHYAEENALYKYLTLQHFAALNEKSYGVTLSNRDCYFMKLGNSTHTMLDDNSGTLNVLAGGRVSNPELGIVGQDGDSIFNQSFALRTHSVFDKAAEMKFALEHQNPFVTGAITGTEAKYPRDQFSFLKIEDPNVLLWSLKTAEDGYTKNGIIVRIWNLGDNTGKGKIYFNNQITEAYETTHVETDIQTKSFSGDAIGITIPSQGMSTYRIKF